MFDAYAVAKLVLEAGDIGIRQGIEQTLDLRDLSRGFDEEPWDGISGEVDEDVIYLEALGQRVQELAQRVDELTGCRCGCS